LTELNLSELKYFSAVQFISFYFNSIALYTTFGGIAVMLLKGIN